MMGNGAVIIGDQEKPNYKESCRLVDQTGFGLHCNYPRLHTPLLTRGTRIAQPLTKLLVDWLAYFTYLIIDSD